VHAFFDASKAFDKVLHNGLYISKVDQQKIPIGFVKLLRQWCSRLSCTDRCMVNWTLLSQFCAAFVKGSVVTILFAIYVDDLIPSRRQCGYGVDIGNLFVGCIRCLCRRYSLAIGVAFWLTKIDGVYETYGCLWDIKFNPTKSQVASFGFRNNCFCDIY